MYTYEEFFEDIARIIAAIIGYSIGLLILLQCWSIARTFLDPWWNLCTSLENWRSQPIPSDDLSLYRLIYAQKSGITQPWQLTVSAYTVRRSQPISSKFMHSAW